MSNPLLDIQDELGTARSFVECAYMACHELEKEHADPLCAVLDAASNKLKDVRDRLAEIVGNAEEDRQ